MICEVIGNKPLYGNGGGGGGAKDDQIIDISAGAFDYPEVSFAPLNKDILANGQILEQWAQDTEIQKVLDGNRRLYDDIDLTGTVTFEVAVKAETAPAANKSVVHEYLHSHSENGFSVDQPFVIVSSGAKIIGTVVKGIYIHSWTQTIETLGWKKSGFLRSGVQRNPAPPDDLVDRLGYLHLRIRIPRA